MIEYLQATNFGAHIRKWNLRHNKGQPLFDDRNQTIWKSKHTQSEGEHLFGVV